MHQLSKDILDRVKNCEPHAIRLLLETIYKDYDKKVHLQKDLADIRYSQGVCYIINELIKLTQPDRK